MLSRRYAAVFLVMSAAFLVVAYLYPTPVAHGADLKCDVEKAYDTICNRDQIGKDGKPTGKKGGVGCKCQETDEKSGKTVIGFCNASVKCVATQTAEGEKPQTCKETGKCPEGGTTPPKQEGGSPPNMPSPPAGGSDPKPNTPAKKVDEAFKALNGETDPKPDEQKPEERGVPIDRVITEADLLKECPTCKPLSEVGKSANLYQQAFNGTPIAEQGFLKTADNQPTSVLSGDITNPSNIKKIDDGLGTNTFQPQSPDVSEGNRKDVTSTFRDVGDLGTLQDRESPARTITPGNPTLDVKTHEESGLVTRLSAKGEVTDEQWGQMVTQAQREMAQSCPSGYSCIMVNNEANREMSVHYSRATGGNLPEGASVLTPNQDKLGSAGGLWSSITGSGPTSADVEKALRQDGALLTMQDGKEYRVTFNENSAKALAPSIANAYDPNESSVWGRMASATGFNSDKIAEGDFVARDPNKPTVVETQIVTEPAPVERPPIRITVTPSSETDTPAARPAAEPSTESPTEQPTTRAPMPASRPASAPSREPAEQTPSGEPASRPAAQPAAQPSGQPASEPSGQPSGQPSSEPSSQPSRTQPQQASSDANLMQRLYCLIFTCQAPQQQAAQQQPQQQQLVTQSPQTTPPQTNPPVTQNQPETPPAQQPRNNQPVPTPTEQPDTSRLPAEQPVEPANKPTVPTRSNPTKVADNKPVNTPTPVWNPSAAQPAPNTQPTPSPNPAVAANGSPATGQPAHSNPQQAPAVAPAPASKATNPISLLSAPAQLVARAVAQKSPESSAPRAPQPVTGQKDPVLTVNKANDNVLAPAVKQTDVAVYNPKAGGTEGEPDITSPDKVPRKAELKVDQGEAGKPSPEVNKPTTPSPEVTRPTVGPNPSGKIGTGGTGDGTGTGVGNGNGSEAGVQAPSACGAKCFAQKALSKLAALTGVTPATAAPSPTKTPADAKRQIDEKLKNLNEAIEESKQLGETAEALRPVKRALVLGREIAEIANGINDPAVKELAGDVNKKALDIQDLIQKYDNSKLIDGSWPKMIQRMKTEMPVKIPDAIKSVNKLTEAVNKAAAPQSPALPGNPGTVSRPPAEAPAPVPAAKRVEQMVNSKVAPGGRAGVLANITNPATAKVVYGMYGIGGSVADTMDPNKNNIGQQVRASKCNCVLVVPDTGAAPGQAGGGTAGALKTPEGAKAFDTEMTNTIAGLTGLPADQVANMKREVVFHSGGFDPGSAMIEALGKKVDGVQALDGMYGRAAETLAEWKKNNPDGTLTSLCASTCGENAKLAAALRAAGVPVNTNPTPVPKGATVAPSGDSHFGTMTNNNPVEKFLAAAGGERSQTAPGQPQPVSRPPANNPLPPALPRIPGSMNSQADRASVAQQTYDLLKQQGIKPSDLTKGSPNYGQAWKSVVETTRQALDARGMLHPQLDLPAVLAVARQETGIPGNRSEFTSTTGVRGYMQVTGGTAQGILGNRTFNTFHGPWDVKSFAREDNIGSVITGALLLNQNLIACNGNVSCAGQTYNSGSPNSCSGQGCVNGVPTYGPAVARDTQVMRDAIRASNGNASGMVDALRSMSSNRSRSGDALGSYASILTGAELGPLSPVKCAYQGCAATPTIEPGNRGYSAGVDRVAEAPTSGLYYRDPHTGAIGVPSDPNMSREDFIRAAREDVAMERLAQSNKLPENSSFQNFKATSNGAAPRAMSTKDAARQLLDGTLNGVFGCSGRACLADDQVYQYGGANADIPAQYADLMKSRLALGGQSNPNGAASASILKAFIGAILMNPEDSKGIVINSAERDLSHVGSDRHNSSGNHESTRAFDLQGFQDKGQQTRFLSRMAAIIQADGLTPNMGVGGNTTHIDTNGSEVSGGGLSWCYSGCAGVSGDLAQLKSMIQSGQTIPESFLDRVTGQATVGSVPTYDIKNANGDTLAKNVALPDGSVGENGDVRLLSNKDGLPLNAGGEQLKDGEKPLQVSSDKALPKPTEDKDGLTFKDERPTQPKADDPWKRGGFANPYPRSGPNNPTSRPTSTCVDNNGQLYGCTPTGGSNPTGGSRPGGGGGGAPMSQPQYPAQQFPRQNPTLPPYMFPPYTPVPTPTVVPPLTASLSCSPSSVPFGTTTPVTVSWSCLSGTASSTGFASAGIPIGRATLNSSPNATTTLRFLLQCVTADRISPVTTCAIPVTTGPKPAVSLSADPNPVDNGGSAIVIWGSSNATRCSLRATSTIDLIDGATDGSTSTVPLYMTTPITLSCSNAAGLVSTTSITIRVR